MGTAMAVVLGAFLDIFGIYDTIIEIFWRVPLLQILDIH